MDKWIAFFRGFAIGVFVVFALFTASGTLSGTFDRSDKAYIAIRTCERELPRSQHCVITAVPEK